MTSPTSLSSHSSSLCSAATDYQPGDDKFPREFTASLALAYETFMESNTALAAAKGTVYIHSAFAVTKFAMTHAFLKPKDEGNAFNPIYFPFTSVDSDYTHPTFSRLTKEDFNQSLIKTFYQLDPILSTAKIIYEQDRVRVPNKVTTGDYLTLLDKHPKLTALYPTLLERTQVPSDIFKVLDLIYFAPNSDNGGFNKQRAKALATTYIDFANSCYNLNLTRAPFVD